LPNHLNHVSQNTSCTIFLAEDDLDDQEFLHEALLAINPRINLVSFTSGLRFMNHIDDMEDHLLPNLIVLDYNIPEINGAEILELLKKNERYFPIPKIVWSTSDSHLYRQNCISYGAKAYLVKPSSIDGIRQIAEEMLSFC
jgi:CheY-like chemotaxis protein